MKLTKAFLAGVALSLSLSAAPAIAATNLPLPTTPVDVAAVVDAATTPEEIAAIVLANPGFEATIISRAMATGGFAIEDIVEAAILADPTKLAIIVEAAVEAVPEQASGIVFAAAGAAGMQFGSAGDEAGDTETAEVIARAAVRGLEAAYGPTSDETDQGVRSITAELFAFLGEEKQLALANAVADETTNPDDTGAGLVEDIQTAATDGFGGSDLLDDGFTSGSSGSPN